MPFAEADLRSVFEATRTLWEDLRGERLLITGGSGFFGRCLLETFSFANRELGLKAKAVAVSRRLPSGDSGFDPAIEWVACDVRQLSPPFPALSGRFAFMIHAAAPASSRVHAQDPQACFDTIVGGTRNALELATSASASTRRFLFLSSGAVYGRQPPELERISEDARLGPDPASPASAYAEGKRSAETLCALYAGKGAGLTPVIARCFAFVGPGMPLDGPFAIGCFIRDAVRGQPIRVESDGTPVRGYLYASDLTVWLWTLLFRGQTNRPYNVGGEQALSLETLARLVASAIGGSHAVPVQIIGKKTDAPRPERYVPSTERARSDFGLRDSVSLEDAIRRTADWARTLPITPG